MKKVACRCAVVVLGAFAAWRLIHKIVTGEWWRTHETITTHNGHIIPMADIKRLCIGAGDPPPADNKSNRYYHILAETETHPGMVTIRRYLSESEAKRYCKTTAKDFMCSNDELRYVNPQHIREYPELMTPEFNWKGR